MVKLTLNYISIIVTAFNLNSIHPINWWLKCNGGYQTIGSSCSSGASRETNWRLDIADIDNVPAYQPPVLPSSPVPVSRVLQLSDLHLQLNYSVGAPVHCRYPICCLPGLPSTERETDPGAEYWGEYTCDLPPWTLDATLKHIAASQPQLDYVLLTGDLPAHDVWLQSQTNNVHSIQVVAAALRQVFSEMELPGAAPMTKSGLFNSTRDREGAQINHETDLYIIVFYLSLLKPFGMSRKTIW